MLRASCLLAFALVAGCQKAPPPSPRPQPSSSAPTAVPSATASALPSAVAAEPKDAAAPSAGPRMLALGFGLTKLHKEPRFAWRQFEQVNWQPVADELPPLPAEPLHPQSRCPSGMVWVEGNFLVDEKARDDTDAVELAQDQACAFWRTADHGLNGLCDRFDREKWLAQSAKLGRKHLGFCIDRYEFPNAYGEFPLVVATYSESETYCKKQDKRVCSESEWTFACEGEEGLPYPYGYERDTTACNIGVMGPGPQKDTFSPRTLARTAEGIDLSWRGKRSGEMPRCKSPFDVYDLTGNVDEWTKSVRKYGYVMIMKGGHWGPARQRCRPQTRGHGPFYVRYDQGFRCCADAP